MTYRRDFLLLLTAGSLTGCWGSRSQSGVERNPGDSAELDRRVDVGGHRLHLKAWGRGSPWVVIDVGLAESTEPWQPVIGRVSAATRVGIYERAGYGSSDPGPLPRTARQAVKELRALLSNAPAEPPYVLVGHSLGAFYVLLFAAEHPELVAGLVLLDPPPRGFIAGERFADLRTMADRQTEEFRRMSGQARQQNDKARAAFFESIASEHEMLFSQTARPLAQIGKLGDLRLTVVASGVPNPAFGPAAEEFQRFWIESNRQLAQLSSRGKFVLADRSSHQLQRDVPDLVSQEILGLVTDLRQTGK